MNNIDYLKQDIELKKKELEKLELEQKHAIRKLAIKDLSEFTDKEKIKIFDKLYKSALGSINTSEQINYHDDDNMHYGGQEYFEILARDRDEFWRYYNSIGKK